MPFAQIAGIGSYLPERRLTNADLERMVDTSDEWIRSRTGIRERRVVAEGESTSDLAARACEAALADAAVSKDEVDMLILGTTSPDYVFPSTACFVQAKLGLTCPAFDVVAACSGWVYGLQIATDAIENGRARTVLVVGAEALTRMLDFTDRTTCVLFGDGAGAVVLRAGDEPGVQCVRLGADGTGAETLKGGFAAANPPSAEGMARHEQFVQMDGKEVYKFAVNVVPKAVEQVLADCRMGWDDVRWFLPHQANERITQACSDRLGVPAEKVVSAIAPVGNTSAASIPLSLDGLYTAGNLTAGDEIVTVGFGAGLTWGAAVIRWTKEAR